MSANVSEELSASVFRVEEYAKQVARRADFLLNLFLLPEVGSDMCPRNVG
jgi:hypothetical protein